MSAALALAKDVDDLFALPEAVVRLNQLLDDPGSTNRHLARVLEIEPALSAKLLRLVNSPAFHLHRQIDEIASAIALIGRTELRLLVLAGSLSAGFRPEPEDPVDIDQFWECSVNTGLLARGLAGRVHLRGQERLFLAGLLAEIGRLALLSAHRAEYRVTVRRAGENREPLEAAERRDFGCDHYELGGALLTLWGLPAYLEDLVAHVRDPQGVDSDLRNEAEVLHAAAAIARWMPYSTPTTGADADAEPAGPQIAPEIAARLALNAETRAQLIDDINQQAIEILRILTPGDGMVF